MHKLNEHMSSQEKGKILEKSVQEIENLILGYKGVDIKDFSVERNKRITRDKIVLHEIDIFVTVNFNNGKTKLYLVECKNWDTKKVSKNDVIILKEKISYTKANYGLFIAQDFTKPAKIIASDSRKIQLIHFNKDNHTNLINAPTISNAIEIDRPQITNFKLSDTFNNSLISIQKLSESLTNLITFKSESLMIDKFLEIILSKEKELLIQRSKNKISKIDCGTINLKRTCRLKFETGDLVFQNRSVDRLFIVFSINYHKYKSIIDIKYDVETKGRYMEMRLIHPDRNGNMKYTTSPNKDKKDKWDVKLVFNLGK